MVSEERQYVVLEKAWLASTLKRNAEGGGTPLRDDAEVKLFARLLNALKYCFVLSKNKMSKQEIVENVVASFKLPSKLKDKLLQRLSSSLSMDHYIPLRRAQKSIVAVHWCIKFSLSNSLLNRVLLPFVEMQLTFNDGCTFTIEASQAKFAVLRYEIAKAMKEMLTLEGSSAIL